MFGNRHPLARPEFDRGVAPADLPMERMLLVLRRRAEQQSALENFLAAQQDETSPSYHQWLTPDEFGARFGASDGDVQTATGWLQAQGFAVARVSRGRGSIEFSGTAGQIESAFRAPIHKYVVNGESHWANAAEPVIPAAVAGVAAGIVSLHDFPLQPQLVVQPGVILKAQGTFATGGHALAPADFATIYNASPVYQAGINGTGATIGVVGRSNVNELDVADFRTQFGLSANPPQIIVNGTDPGDLGGSEEIEALLDVSWSGAVAPAATVKFVVSKSTAATDGALLSTEYIVDNNLADVMTASFGACEARFGQNASAFESSLAQQAAAEGITYLAATGDSGSAACDASTSSSAQFGLAVSAPASTPYTLAVGGTQFDNSAQYWAASNGTYYSSALTRIPESVWNESCAASTCGSSANLAAGGGGASTMFTKPAWQSGVAGIPADGKRDVPDVSLTAAGGVAPYLLCVGGSCRLPNAKSKIYFSGVGGTSASTPSFAGIIALIVQKAKGRQGLANVRLYQLAAAAQWSQCDGSSTSTAVGSGCVFNDVTAGNNAVPGESGYGTASAQYTAGSGYDLASRLGSVNVNNLVNQWAGTGNPNPTPTPSAPPTPAGVSVQSAGGGENVTATFNDPRGWQDLGVVNVLINNFLDGRNACYLAYSRALGLLYLVNDSGSGLTAGIAPGGNGAISNSQCSVQAAGSSATGSGNALTLSLNVTFASGFGGSKVMYLAARDVANDSSGWYPMGVYRVAGAASATTTSVVGMSPATGAGHAQSFTFTFSDTKGWQDIGVVDVLVNGALDGRAACYVAYARSTNTLYLFDDTGAPLPGQALAGQALAGSGSVSNSQCSVSFAGSSAVGTGNTLTLTLSVTFTSAFDGDRIFYLAARDGSDANNTGWQAMGAWTVQ